MSIKKKSMPLETILCLKHERETEREESCTVVDESRVTPGVGVVVSLLRNWCSHPM